MGKYDTTFGGWVLRGFWSSYVVSVVVGGFAFGWIWAILITALSLSIGIPLTLAFLYEHDYIFATKPKIEFPDTKPCGFVKPHEIDRRANPPTPKNDKNKPQQD